MKKFFILFYVLCLFSTSTIYAQIGIGTNSPNVSSVLDLQSTNKGLLIPRLSTTERNAISSPAQGLLIYNTTVDSFQYRNASNWVTLNSSNFNIPNHYDGSSNVGFGAGVLDSLKSGFGNAAVGDYALANVQTSNGNTVLGYGALLRSKYSSFNIAIGSAAMQNDTMGNGNVVIGFNSGSTSRNGSYNTLIGSYTNIATGNLTNATALGYGTSVDSSNKVRIGNNNVISTEIAGRLRVNGQSGINSFTLPITRGSNGQVLTADGNGSSSWEIFQAVTGPQGPVGAIGPQGPAGANGQGVPAGGTTGQVLTKTDGTDYNAAWVTPPTGGGSFSPTLHLFVAQTASQSFATANTNNLVDFGTPSTNVSNQFNTTTETFTAAVAGWYNIHSLLATTSAASGWEARLFVNNVLVSAATTGVFNDTEMYATVQTMIYLNANETVRANLRRNNSPNAVTSTATGFLRIVKMN